MKQFMILLVTLPLLLVFCMQFSLDQTNKAKTEIIDEIVYAAKEQAKQDGCFTSLNKQAMINSISQRIGVAESAVSITADSTPKNRMSIGSNADDGLIHYRISVDIGEAMAGAGLFGIGRNENRYRYTIDSYTVSEYLP